jgi:protein SCO1/2
MSNLPATAAIGRRSLLLAGLAGASVAALWLARPRRSDPGWATATPELQAILWPMPRPVADFELRTQHGRSFDAAQLRGQWSFLYFGYLQCPDVCPTTMQALHGLRELLVDDDPEAAATRFVFVSVDPGNDTPERIGAYLAYFDRELLGLSGDPAQLGRLATSLGVMYAEHVDDKGVRSMDHTTSIIVVDPQGRGVAALAGPHQPRTMHQRFGELRRHLGG